MLISGQRQWTRPREQRGHSKLETAQSHNVMFECTPVHGSKFQPFGPTTIKKRWINVLTRSDPEGGATLRAERRCFPDGALCHDVDCGCAVACAAHGHSTTLLIVFASTRVWCSQPHSSIGALTDAEEQLLSCSKRSYCRDASDGCVCHGESQETRGWQRLSCLLVISCRVILCRVLLQPRARH